MASLDSLLGGGPSRPSPEPASVPDAAPQPGSAPEVSGQPQEGEAVSAPPAQVDQKQSATNDDSEDDAHPVPRKALLEERKKRQELERQLAENTGRLAVYERQQQPPAPKPKADEDDFWGDPKSFVEKRLEDVQLRSRLELSEELMRSTHPDYAEKEAAFLEAAKSNPALFAQLRQQRNPAKYAYESGKAFLEMKSIGSMDDWKAQERAKIRAEVEAELRKGSALEAAKTASKSSVDARGTGAQTAPVVVHKSLDNIFGTR